MGKGLSDSTNNTTSGGVVTTYLAHWKYLCSPHTNTLPSPVLLLSALVTHEPVEFFSGQLNTAEPNAVTSTGSRSLQKKGRSAFLHCSRRT